MNLFLIYGLENYLIDKKINEIIKKSNVVSDNIIRLIYRVLLTILN